MTRKIAGSHASKIMAFAVLSAITTAQPATAQPTPSQAAKDLLLKAPPPPDLTITAIGQQSGWQYTYRQPGGTSTLSASEACRAVVVPQGKHVQLQVTSSDTIHEWHVPALGIKATAIPGRIESVDLKTSQLGTFAGNDNQRIAITISIVTPVAFAAWQRTCLAP